MAFNDLLNVSGNQITAGTYTVDPTGRVTLSGVVPQPLNVTFSFQIYLDGNGNALTFGADPIQTTASVSFQQSAPSQFAGTYALAAQGYLNASGLPYWGTVGPVTVSSDSFNGSTDYTVQGYAPNSGVPLSGTENSSTGLLTLTGLNAINFQASSGYGYYPIDSNRVLAVAVNKSQLGLLLLEGVNENVNTNH